MNNQRDYLLLGNGEGYEEYRFCSSIDELFSIINKEKPENYDIILRTDDDVRWKKVLIVKNGKPVPGYDETLIPEPLKPQL